MYLAELFDTKGTSIQYNTQPNAFRAVAPIGGRNVQFMAQTQDGSAWEVNFAEVKEPKWHNKGDETAPFGVTGSGNEMQVFGFVVNALKTFLQKYKPHSVEFTASKGDGNRSNLYARMAKRIKVPGYSFVGRNQNHSASADGFLIIRDDLLD